MRNDITKKINKKGQKANKIISVIKEFKDLLNSNVLDIGCGTGIISSNLSKYFKKVYGVDVVDNRIIKEGYIFKKVKNEKLLFKNKFFDVIISNQVIEHVNNPEKHLSEIYRVMKKDGICYLATPNKYWPIEPHYYLLFLAILPKKLANLYLRIFRNKDYDAYLFSYGEIYKKLKKYFIVKNLTKQIIINSNKYYLESKYKIIPRFIIKLIPESLLNYLVPSFILILKKK